MTEELQLLLPFDIPEVAPVVLDLPHFENPKDDNERLLEYQYQYRKGDQDALKKIYDLSVTVAVKMIKDIGKKNVPVKRMPLWVKNEKAHQAATYMISQLLRKPGWAIKTSFTAYIFLRVKHELFYQRKVDRIVEFVDMDSFFKEEESAFDEY